MELEEKTNEKEESIIREGETLPSSMSENDNDDDGDDSKDQDAVMEEQGEHQYQNKDVQKKLSGNSRASKKRRRKKMKRKNSKSDDFSNDNGTDDDEKGMTSSESTSSLAHKLPPAITTTTSSLSSSPCSPTNDTATTTTTSTDGSNSATVTNTTTNTNTNNEPKTEYKVIHYPTGEVYRGTVLSSSLASTITTKTTTTNPTNKSSIIRHGQGAYTDKHQNIYEGSWRNNRANGHGTKTFAHGGKHEGFYKNDKRHGFGKYCWSNGDTFVGEWYKGKMHGRGTFVWGGGDLYEGEWRMGKMHGRGTKRMANGDFYEGTFADGMASGWGKKHYFCGDVHEGTYVKDKRCGFGLYVWVNGDRYVGNWRNGRMHGRGVKIMSSGDMYNGQWVADKAQGYGVKLFSNGDRHEGYYEEDKRHGYGTYNWASGDQYMGYWFKGRMCGLGVKLMANGDSYDGEWFADQAHGFGIKKFANGDEHIGYYCHDVRENDGAYRWVNGDEFEGCWKNGEQTGIGEYKYRNGDSFIGRWENGRKHGPGYFRTAASSTENAEEIEELPNGDGNAGLAQQEGSIPTIKTSKEIRKFFEVWSRGSRIHREEVTNFADDDLKSVTDMCKPRSLAEIVHARKQMASVEVSSLSTDIQQQQRTPLGTVHEDSSPKYQRENNPSIADRWRWVWEADANSGASGFWGRRLRRVDITRSILSVATDTTEIGAEHEFHGNQDAMGDVSDNNMSASVHNEPLQIADGVDRHHLAASEGVENHEQNVIPRDPLSQVLFAEHISPYHGTHSTEDNFTCFQTTGASDDVSLASVGSAVLEFATCTNESALERMTEPLKSREHVTTPNSDADAHKNTLSSPCESNQKQDLPIDKAQKEKKSTASAKRSHIYIRDKPLSFCSSSSNSTFGRRRIVDGTVRLSKRRISGRSVGGSLTKRKKPRRMESQALSLPIPGVCKKISEERESSTKSNEAVSSKSDGPGDAAADLTEVLNDIGSVRSPSPRHSGGDASGAS